MSTAASLDIALRQYSLEESFNSVEESLIALAMRLKALRDKHGWTQADLAKCAGVSPGYIGRLETHRHDPKLSTVVKLAKALGVKVGRLLEWRTILRSRRSLRP